MINKQKKTFWGISYQVACQLLTGIPLFASGYVAGQGNGWSALQWAIAYLAVYAFLASKDTPDL